MISSSVIKFLLIPGVHPLGGVVGGWMGWEWVWVCGRCPIHTCMHTHMHACTCMLNMINTDASMLAATCNFCTCVCVCACMCACVCMHVYMCGGHPHPPTHTSTHPHPLRATGSPKHQNSISLELIEIIRFGLKILYL